MGGPPSTLVWQMGYDNQVAAIGGPTYAGDLAGLQRGPRRAFRMQFFPTGSRPRGGARGGYALLHE
eukprot:3588235-Lingulodinium_polyedra.AAC.1